MQSKFLRRRQAELGMVHQPGAEMPHTPEEVRDVEARLQRKLPTDYVTFLTTLGGHIAFDVGAVVLGIDDLDVTLFWGIGDFDTDLARLYAGRTGQLPVGWVPFAKSSSGNFYCFDTADAVWHIELKEELLAREKRPPAPPPGARKVASGFFEFLGALRLPAWATS